MPSLRENSPGYASRTLALIPVFLMVSTFGTTLASQAQATISKTSAKSCVAKQDQRLAQKSAKGSARRPAKASAKRSARGGLKPLLGGLVKGTIEPQFAGGSFTGTIGSLPVPVLRGTTNGTIGRNQGDSTNWQNPLNCDAFTSAGCWIGPNQLGPTGEKLGPHGGILGPKGEETKTSQFEDIFNRQEDVADWWKEERYAETYSEDAFSPAKPVDDFVDRKTAIAAWSKKQMPLRVYISLTVTRARDGAAKDMIKECINEWIAASNHTISYEMTDDFRNCDIYFCQHSTADNYWAQTLQEFHQGQIETAKILILERTLQYMPPRRFKAVMLHQIGHALGLDDSTNRASVMSQYCSDVNFPVNQVTEFDKTDLHQLYVTREARAKMHSRPVVATVEPN